MIEFLSETAFSLENEKAYIIWIEQVIEYEGYSPGDISYIFCDDEYLHKINLEFLNHDTLTDIITFDYTVGKQVHGEIYISIERVKENAGSFSDSFESELKRVMIHGILHLLGYKDKTEEQQTKMRSLENNCIAIFPK
tara:strand:+ start:208888 stop:209301 length:414 start_codon:yes stop_codon:yes gene_type:complete